MNTGKANDVSLEVVVNGKQTTVEANPNEPLRAVAQKALNLSGNSGQPLQNWELRDATGSVLDLARKVGEFHFANGTTLFLTLKAGVGG